MANETASEQSCSPRRLTITARSIVGLLDFLICIYLVSLFFHGTMPGKQQLREAFRQVYSFMLDPANLFITSVIGVRLSLYGISRVIKFRLASKTND